MKTFSDDLNKAGSYPLRLFAHYEGDEKHYANPGTLDFTIVLVDPCIAATLTIDDSVVTSDVITYYLGDSPDQQSFLDEKVTSTEVITTCPDIVFYVVQFISVTEV